MFAFIVKLFSIGYRILGIDERPFADGPVSSEIGFARASHRIFNRLHGLAEMSPSATSASAIDFGVGCRFTVAAVVSLPAGPAAPAALSLGDAQRLLLQVATLGEIV